MSQTLTKPILLDETGQAIKTALQNIDETESQDWLLMYEDVHSEMDDTLASMADSLEGIKDILVAQNSEPIGIQVLTPPTKTIYDMGETFDPTGMVVAATMDTGINKILVDVTSGCQIVSPDTSSTIGNLDVTINWTHIKSGTTFTTTTTIVISPPDWSDGTDEQIAIALQKHYSNDIDLTRYWSVGDERTVHLTAKTKSLAEGGKLAEQDIVLVITNVGGKTLTTPINGHTTCVFQVDCKSRLADVSGQYGYTMNGTTATNVGRWNTCVRRTWLNDTFYSALPLNLKSIFKQIKNVSGQGGTTTTTTTTDDYFALRSEIETTGSHTRSVAGEGSLIKYYETSSNRLKGETYYFRSADTTYSDSWVCMSSTGEVQISDQALTIAPFGAI